MVDRGDAKRNEVTLISWSTGKNKIRLLRAVVFM